MSIKHKTSVISLNLIKKDLTNEVSIAMLDDAIMIINEAEVNETKITLYEELVDIFKRSYQQQMPMHDYMRRLEIEKKLEEMK